MIFYMRQLFEERTDLVCHLFPEINIITPKIIDKSLTGKANIKTSRLLAGDDINSILPSITRVLQSEWIRIRGLQIYFSAFPVLRRLI